MRQATIRMAFVAACALASGPALAGDGAVEISQASIAAAGGFPFAIAQPGRYVLTGNLAVATATSAIVASVDGVHLDLNGFEIAGPGSCSATIASGLNTGTTCSGSVGSSVGVDGAAVVENGRVRGFRDGIAGRVGGTLRVARVVVRENARYGVYDNSTAFSLSDSVLSTNAQRGAAGQNVNGSATIARCIFEKNGSGATVDAGVVRDSVFTQNVGDGLNAFSGDATLVVDNVFQHNGVGLRAISTTGYRSNVFDGNTTHIVSGSGNLGENLCAGNPCP